MGRSRGGLTTKLHALVDADGRPVGLRLTGGQVHDACEAEALIEAIPEGATLLGDKGYDSDLFRAALSARGITPCIPPRSNRKVQYHYDKAIYKKRHLVENLFAKIKDWRRIHTRYDRCAHTFMSSIVIF